MIEDSEPEENEIDVADISSTSSILARWLAIFLLHLQSTYRMSKAVVQCLFSFLATFLLVLGQLSAPCREVAKAFPRSAYLARGKFCEKVTFKRYVACRKCKQVYLLRDCIEVVGGQKKCKPCPHQQYPNHPQHRMRKPCGAPLLKAVKLNSGKQIFYPYRTYCFLGLKVALARLVKIPGFLEMCNEWRNRKDNRIIKDVYDGNVWTEFQSYKYERFLQDRNSLGLMLNIDFFQPFKHTTYSVGAIYFSILNLPRSVRYRSENIILAGLIPGPDEPELDLNSFLKPLVEELQALWGGIDMPCASGMTRKVRCALLCVACDLPAGRKVCGFLSYTAKYGCSFCKKAFAGGVGSTDYSGFNRDSWPKRTGDMHRRDAFSLKSHKTKADKTKSESKLGCRYSVLLELQYFNAPRFLIVDPMHNLYLGTAKHFLKRVWIEGNIIGDHMLDQIQDCVNAITVPAGMGRIPYKIRSGFSSFTANQWQNWVNHFSLIALCDILSTSDLECWRHLVLASRLLCQKQITANDIKLADALLQFCRRTERLYGKEVITPNMHMHTHLASCVEDYGPLHSFWLYAFERYNGILGGFPNSNRSIEIQLMQRFLYDQEVKTLSLPEEFQDKFDSHFCRATAELVGSVAETVNPYEPSTAEDSDIILSKSRKRFILNSEVLQDLTTLYCKLYSCLPGDMEIPSYCLKYMSIQIKGKRLGSCHSNSKASSLVLALWQSDFFGEPIVSGLNLPTDPLRAAQINYFIEHSFQVDGTQHKQTLVSLSWFKYHCQHFCLGKPLSVWCSDIFETGGLHYLIPISFIKCRTVSLVTSLQSVPSGESVLIVSPCIDF